ncbi:MAG: hypothetical protein N2Z81_07280 [Hydrogenothermaceae bacterium]|nr:hypothetical protein [Hydrogenothermaceae bacterium]
MADFTKAGTDRGDLEKEINHILISTKITHHSYLVNIDSLSKEELEFDLMEYQRQLATNILPLIKKAESTKSPKIVDMAYEIRHLMEDLISKIEDRIKQL